MGVSRRTLLAGLPLALSATACAGKGLMPPAITAARCLVEGPQQARVPAAGWVILKDGVPVAGDCAGTARQDGAPFTPDTPFRAASISKLVTALTAGALSEAGRIDLDAPMTLVQGQDFVLRQLLSHTSGLSDPDVYWIAHPGDIRTLLAPASARRHAPGRFEYCNLGYGIAATLMEQATGERFDRLAHALVLQPLGLDAGFNWSGVSPDKRARGATLYRETADGWQVQADGADVLDGDQPSALMEAGATLDTYRPGQNGTLFSPQGGLRASLLDLARIAASLADHPGLTAPVWSLDAAGSNGIHDSRYFTQFATGVHLYPPADSPWPGQALLGHHGEAYGLYAGAWHAPGRRLSFAYAVTGTPTILPPATPSHPALNPFTERLFEAVLDAAASRRSW